MAATPTTPPPMIAIFFQFFMSGTYLRTRAAEHPLSDTLGPGEKFPGPRSLGHTLRAGSSLVRYPGIIAAGPENQEACRSPTPTLPRSPASLRSEGREA